MLDSTGFTGAFNDGVIYIYTGPQPVNADAAVQGTLLGIVSVNGGTFAFGSPTNGLGWEAAAAGVIVKETTEVWSMTASGNGTAGWFRLMGNTTDNLGSSTTLARLDGSVAQSGGDLNLSSTNIVSGQPTSIDVFQFTLPAS
jgi:hypothetical protein